MTKLREKRDWSTIPDESIFYWTGWNIVAFVELVFWLVPAYRFYAHGAIVFTFWVLFVPAEILGAFVLKKLTGLSGWTLSEYMYCVPWGVRYIWALVLALAGGYLVHPVLIVLWVVLSAHWVAPGNLFDRIIRRLFNAIKFW